MSKDYPNNLPARYGRSKLSMVRGWWNGQSGAIMRRMVPQIWPGIPVEAHLGFVSNAGWGEDTALTPSRISFHELGGYGTEGGPSNLLAPNTNPANNSWFRLHNDSRVMRLLGGRTATMTPFRQIGPQTLDIPLEDQIAIGAVNLFDALTQIKRRIPASVAPQRNDSLWAVALSFMAWSAGVGGAASHIRKYASDLAQVPEERRWEALIRAIAQKEERRGAVHSRSPAYSVMRTQQKLRVGRELAREVGGNVAWFGQIDEQAEDIVARKASRTAVEIVGQVASDAGRAAESAVTQASQAVQSVAAQTSTAFDAISIPASNAISTMPTPSVSVVVPAAIFVVAIGAVAYVMYTRSKRGK